MSYAVTYDDYVEQPLVVPIAEAPARSRLMWLPFLAPAFIAGISWVAGGVPLMTDVAFLILTIICAVLLCLELIHFPRRKGIGGILAFGGVLVWFCHDYMTLWFLRDFHAADLPGAGLTPYVVAKAAFYHCLFVMLMVLMLPIPLFRVVDKIVVAVPEPNDIRFYLGLVALMMMVGCSAFFFSDENFPLTFVKGGLWFALGPPRFNVGRTGNLNYNWGGYVANIIQVGQVAGIMGAFYALLVARNWAGKLFGWFCWLYWVSFSYPGERRGDMAFMIIPVMGMLFLKYCDRALRLNKSTIFAYIFCGVFACGLWYLIAVQSAARWKTDEVKVFRAVGNTMFSEGLQAWAIIPDIRDFAYNSYPGETIIRPLPDKIIEFIVGPIPRALWHNKPGPSDFSLWYSSYLSNDKGEVNTGGLTGTTVSSGAVGEWYFLYGTSGVIQGALLYGWLMGVAERSLHRAKGRPIALLFSLGFATFLFKAYRDLWWHALDPLLLAWILLMIVIKLFFSSSPHHDSGVVVGANDSVVA